MCVNGQIQFFVNNSKNIDIWILHRTKIIQEWILYVHIPNFIKIDKEFME